MLANILYHTNKKIDSLLAKLTADFYKDFKYSFVKEVSEMELKAFIGLSFYLIETLSTNSSLAGLNISFDRLYTSIPLAKWLLEKQITCIGTMQLNKKDIPD